ncbi:hypothetical protein ADICYQ_2668 [Cyclobacterium qasimii M12-11B]|uniref:Uncharacterized protein n=1 Tax=Cyclobacterium qasimii M12-11B TaxID=641524 RepID=S7WVY9_9BACT|nr:hypothetical protein ADICYQ_2668 [Cyclobacterium qasimii M12-11B]
MKNAHKSLKLFFQKYQTLTPTIWGVNFTFSKLVFLRNNGLI